MVKKVDAIKVDHRDALEAKNEAGLLLLHQMLALTLYNRNYPAVMVESIESDQSFFKY